MKFAMMVLSGVADLPSDRLSGRTPLQAARTPALDQLARSGRLGTVATAPPGMHLGSDVALLTLFGYDPQRHVLRRGPLEACGIGLAMELDDLVFRGNLVTVHEDRIADLTAGRISSSEARVLLADLADAIDDPDLSFVSLGGYRFLMHARGWRTLQVVTRPPHFALGKTVDEVRPRGEDGDRLVQVLDRAAALLAEHEVNRVRVDLGENPANQVWLWGEGSNLDLPSFESQFHVQGAAVAGAALARGVALKAGLDVAEVPGATGDLDTDLSAKAIAVRQQLTDHDLVFVHVQAANEASHLRDVRRKTRVIEELDEQLVGPLLDELTGRDDLRIMVATDHVTATESDQPTEGQAPFLLTGADIQPVREYPFDEAHAARADLHIEDGAALMEFFLRHPGG